MKCAIILIIIVLFIPSAAPAKTLHIWTDKNGVVHITNRPPPANIQTDKMDYKPKTDTERARRSHQIKYEKELQRLQRERKDKTRESAAKTEARKREARMRKEERDRKTKERKLKRSKEYYEYLKSRKPYYQEKLRKARREEDRLYWKAILEDVERAKRKYYDLQGR